MSVSNMDDVIDSRDIIEAIEEFENTFESEYEDYKIECEEEYDEICAKKEIDNEERDFLEWAEDNVKSFEEFKEEHEDFEEYKVLLSVAEEGKDYNCDWSYGATLIRDSYFEEYTKEFCNDCGFIPDDIPSWIEIDWSATSDNLLVDYTEIDFDGVTYYILST